MQQASGSTVPMQRSSSSATLTCVLWDLKRCQHSVKDLAPSTDLILLGGGRGTHSLQSVEVESHAGEDTMCVLCAVDLSTLLALAVMQLQPVRKAADEESVE